MTQRFGPRCRGLFLLFAVGLASCSGKSGLNPVQGKVTQNNQAVPGALVTFHPKKADLKVVPPTALTKEDGTFTVMTGDKEGAAAGDYVITIICSEIPEGSKKVVSTAGVDTVDRFKGAYANRDSSQINVTVKKGANQLEPFNLK